MSDSCLDHVREWARQDARHGFLTDLLTEAATDGLLGEFCDRLREVCGPPPAPPAWTGPCPCDLAQPGPAVPSGAAPEAPQTFLDDCEPRQTAEAEGRKLGGEQGQRDALAVLDGMADGPLDVWVAAEGVVVTAILALI